MAQSCQLPYATAQSLRSRLQTDHLYTDCDMLQVSKWLDRGLGRPDLAAGAKTNVTAAVKPLQLPAQKIYSYWDASGEQVTDAKQHEQLMMLQHAIVTVPAAHQHSRLICASRLLQLCRASGVPTLATARDRSSA